MKTVAYDTYRRFALFHILKCFVCSECVWGRERVRKNVHTEHLNMQMGILFQFPEVNDLCFLSARSATPTMLPPSTCLAVKYIFMDICICGMLLLLKSFSSIMTIFWTQVCFIRGYCHILFCKTVIWFNLPTFLIFFKKKKIGSDDGCTTYYHLCLCHWYVRS